MARICEGAAGIYNPSRTSRVRCNRKRKRSPSPSFFVEKIDAATQTDPENAVATAAVAESTSARVHRVLGISDRFFWHGRRLAHVDFDPSSGALKGMSWNLQGSKSKLDGHSCMHLERMDPAPDAVFDYHLAVKNIENVRALFDTLGDRLESQLHILSEPRYEYFITGRIKFQSLEQYDKHPDIVSIQLASPICPASAVYKFATPIKEEGQPRHR